MESQVVDSPPTAHGSRAASRRPRFGGLVWFGVCVWIAFHAFALWRATPPEVVPADAPPSRFSAARALDLSRRIEGDGRPHPLGSDEAARVRELLVSELRALGLDVEIQDRLTSGTSRFGPSSTVARVRNVIAIVPGRERAPADGSGERRDAVLVCAHYDSVAAGPGASDDGAGVAAIVEIARALRSGPPPRHDVVLLLNEGEEAGLLGASAFVRFHPLASRVAVVVNLEARGTSGRAQMFETSSGNAALIERYAQHIERPAALSSAYELYRRMPNDTDLTVFKQAGMAGLNFAFIGDVSRYHTPLDDVAHLDPRSLQHLGESGLASVRALADGDLPLRRDPSAMGGGDAVYVDVFGFLFLHASAAWCAPLAVLALVVLVLAALGVPRRRGATHDDARDERRLAARAAVATLLAIVAAAIVAHGVVWIVVAWHGAFAPWSVHPLPLRVAVVASAFAAGLASFRWFVAPRGTAGAARVEDDDSATADAVRGRATLAGAHLVLAIGACALAFVAPGASYLWLFPALVAAASRFLGSSRLALVTSWCATLVALAFTSSTLIVGVEEGFGFHAGAAWGAPLGIVAALVGTAFAWTRPSRAPIGVCAATAVVGTLAACAVEPRDEHAPSWLHFVHVEVAGEPRARWFARGWDRSLPDAVVDAGGFGGRRERPVAGWTRWPEMPVADAERTNDAPPRLDVLPPSNEAPRAADRPKDDRKEEARPNEVRQNDDRPQESRPKDDRRRVRARLVSPRGARQFFVRAPEGARWVSIRHGADVLTEGFARAGRLAFGGVDPDGVEVEIDLPARADAEVEVIDWTPTLPSSGDRLRAARGPNFVPRGEGDARWIVNRVRL